MTRAHKLFLKWLLQFSLMSFFIFFIFDQGLIIKIVSSDKSYITSFILVLFFVISMHCFYHTFIISDELNKAHIIKKTVGFYEFGWFCSDIMLKLGLIGTVIGFIIMLGSLSDITTFDVTLLQGVLTTMGSGMGVALYTTLSALVAGVMVAVQYYNLESGCEELFSVLNQISEVSIDNSL